MARVLGRLWTAQPAINNEAGGKRICPCVEWRGSSGGSFGSHSRFVVAAIPYRCKYSSVVSDRERRANIHGALSGIHFLRRLRLFGKMNRRFVVVVIQKIWRLLKT